MMDFVEKVKKLVDAVNVLAITKIAFVLISIIFTG